jgi:NADH-quinone oxidoreductase subunit A
MSGIAQHYLPILLFFVVGIVFAFIFVGAPVVVSKLAGTSKPDTIKLSEYESGFPAFSDSRGQFDVRFYLVAILFIVFDLEAAFLFPWAISLHWSGQAGWWAMMEFLAELALGLAYAWKVGALEWE